MMTTQHGAGEGAFTATSFCAKGTIYLRQRGQEIAVDPDELRALVGEHDPEGFYDDYPVAPAAPAGEGGAA